MKDLAQYFKLWQQKRNDLEVDMDPQADWDAMHQLLDVQMPVNNVVPGTQVLIKTALVHIAKFKLIYTLAALLAAGTITYFALRSDEVVKSNKFTRSEIKKRNIAGTVSPSINTNGATDSLSNNNGAVITPAVDKTANKAVSNKNNTGAKNAITNGAASNNTVGNRRLVSTNKNNEKATCNSTNSALLPKSTVNNKTGNKINGGSSSGHIASNGANLLKLSHHNHSRYNGKNGRLNNSAVRVNEDAVLGGTRQTRFSGPNTGGPATGLLNNGQMGAAVNILQPQPPKLIFNWDTNTLLARSYNGSSVINKTLARPANSQAAAAAAKTKNKSTFTLPIDWGVLAGINSPGSFTTANKNNTNGVPFDAYAGLFATYNLNDKWGINLQTRLPTPHPVSGNYSHTEEGKADTSKIAQTVTSKVTDSRKMYTADIALHLVYNVAPNIGIKFGPVLTLPLKQANGVSSVSTSGTPKDSAAYFTKLTGAINGTNIEKKIRYAVSGGVSLNYKRFLLDATYYHSFQTQKVSSDLGGYTSNTNSLQLTIGFRLNKNKK